MTHDCLLPLLHKKVLFQPFVWEGWQTMVNTLPWRMDPYIHHLGRCCSSGDIMAIQSFPQLAHHDPSFSSDTSFVYVEGLGRHNQWYTAWVRWKNFVTKWGQAWTMYLPQWKIHCSEFVRTSPSRQFRCKVLNAFLKSARLWNFLYSHCW